ncbi:phosphorelay sensor kinase [Aureococcus anophagefferens]|nr:phosphorelay sensor kinase [Aureococcus anophagefferens]
MNRLIDFGFFVDLLLAFNTAYFDEASGHWVTDRYVIARSYLQAWFWLDLVSLVPYSVLPVSEKAGLLRFVKLARLMRLLRAFKSPRILANLYKHITLHNRTQTLVKYITLLIVTIHWSACCLRLATSIHLDKCGEHHDKCPATVLTASSNVVNRIPFFAYTVQRAGVNTGSLVALKPSRDVTDADAGAAGDVRLAHVVNVPTYLKYDVEYVDDASVETGVSHARVVVDRNDVLLRTKIQQTLYQRDHFVIAVARLLEPQLVMHSDIIVYRNLSLNDVMPVLRQFTAKAKRKTRLFTLGSGRFNALLEGPTFSIFRTYISLYGRWMRIRMVLFRGLKSGQNTHVESTLNHPFPAARAGRRAVGVGPRGAAPGRTPVPAAGDDGYDRDDDDDDLRYRPAGDRAGKERTTAPTRSSTTSRRRSGTASPGRPQAPGAARRRAGLRRRRLGRDWIGVRGPAAGQ